MGRKESNQTKTNNIGEKWVNMTENWAFKNVWQGKIGLIALHLNFMKLGLFYVIDCSYNTSIGRMKQVLSTIIV